MDNDIPVRIKGVGGAISSIPAVLGMTPEESLAVMYLEHGKLVLSARFDLGIGIDAALDGHLAGACKGVRYEGREITHMLAVIVSETMDLADQGLLALNVVDAAERFGIIPSVLSIPRFAEGAEWTDLIHGRVGGKIDDPRTGALATARRVLVGDDGSATESELVDFYRFDGTPLRPALLRMTDFDDAIVAADVALSLGDGVQDALEQVLSHIDADLSPRMMLRALEGDPAMIRVLREVTRRTAPGAVRYKVGMLEANAHLGDTDLVAARRVLEVVDPEHDVPTTRLMLAALSSGAHPRQIVDLLRRAADDLGM